MARLKEEGMNYIAINSFVKGLNKYGLSKQQLKTLKGQALKGDLVAAEKGLDKLLMRRVQNGYSKNISR